MRVGTTVSDNDLNSAMTLSFRAYDESRCGYPRPRIPATPPLELNAFGRSASTRFPSCFEGSTSVFFSRGRYALFHALRTLGVDDRHGVMVPAYHCRTMIDPVVRAGASVSLFPLMPDLSPALDRFAALVSASPRPIKALLLPHYFGFPQEVEPVLSFCRARGIALIEDCCHAYFGSWHGRTLGTWGDCAIGSPSKFFACADGGTFASQGSAAAPQMQDRPAVDELRGVSHSIEGAWRQMNRRFGADAMQALVSDSASVQDRFPQWDRSTEPDGNETLSAQYQPGLESTSGLAGSRVLMRLSNVERICERRRDTYAALLAGVKNLPNCAPLFSALPDGVVPYMFPLLIELPQHRFHWLKHLGVPMYRWDELALSDCAMSGRYRLQLVHLPCHQAMHEDEVSWLLKALSLVMHAQPKSGRLE